jgi:Tfp pilus assembly protein PilF
MTSSLASTTKSIKGGFSTVGTALTSAYSKTKQAVTSPFTSGTPKDSQSGITDPTSLASKTNSVAPEFQVVHGQMYEQQGQFDKAKDLYSKALEIDPQNLVAITAIARLHDRLNESDKSIEYYKRAIDISPSTDSLYSELAGVYAKNKQTSLAKEQLKKAIALDPKQKSYRMQLASVLIDEGQNELAIQEIGQVETPAMAQYQMAYLHMSRQNVPVAQQHLQNALTIDPNLKPARDLMASIGNNPMLQQAGQQASRIYQQGSQITSQLGQLGTNVQSAFATPASYGVPSAAPTTQR